MVYGCQQNLINPDKETKAILEYICSEANHLTNCGIYYSRQLYFKAGKIPSKADLHKQLGTIQQNKHYHALYSDTAQQILTSVAESFKSYLGLLKGIKKGTVAQSPKLPNYRKSGGFSVATFTARSIKLKGEMLRFPLGTQVKAWFGLDAFYLPMPSNLEWEAIKEVRILPRNQCFYVEFVYEMETAPRYYFSEKRVLGIDPGINNWLTCVSNIGTSFIVDGRHLKSMNQYYNKRVSTLKENKPQGFWSKQLANITEKRNRQVRDAVNKAARIVISHCIENHIGAVIFGWNRGQRQNINLGSKTNQNFVQIPTARLKDRIGQLCEYYRIKFVETEESYTSKSSFVDDDLLPTFGAKPEGWQPSGKRVKRGLYRTAQGYKINADCNGAANIIRKVAAMLKFDLSGASRGCLSQPKKVLLWTLQKSPRLQTGEA